MCPFILQEEIIYRYANKIYKKEIKPVFPGYVFIDTNLDNNGILKLIMSFIRENKEVIRILRYGDSDEIALRDEEWQRYLVLCGEDRCMQNSTGYIIGERFI